jgi:hypothetical protein
MVIIRAVRWLLLLLGILDLVALKAGWISHRPEVLAALFSAALIAFIVRLVQCIRALATGRRRGRVLAEAIVTSGVLIAVAAGTVNWLLSLQGFVILNQQETVQLHGGTELQAFDAGPLARLEEMGVVLGLDELELVAAGVDGFYPRSRLRIWRHHDEPISLEVEPRRSGTAGPLHFHQGAFGFAPRIVITKGADPQTTVFDRVVPFLTERRGPHGISFDGSFTIAKEDILVEGAIDLESLDEGMRGHATLDLAVSRDGEALGAGRLLPGHFADIEEGYRIGFAGLERWSEIVISRRSYGHAVLAGTGLFVVGAVLWLVAVWRER